MRNFHKLGAAMLAGGLLTTGATAYADSAITNLIASRWPESTQLMSDRVAREPLVILLEKEASVLRHQLASAERRIPRHRRVSPVFTGTVPVQAPLGPVAQPMPLMPR